MEMNTISKQTLATNTVYTEKRTCKTYKRRRTRRSTVPEVPDELVLEILARLPVKALVRFKTVCKAWRAITSDPLFIRKHLQQSTNKHEQTPSFLLVPHTLDQKIDSEPWPTTFSNNIPFYVWQEGQDITHFMHAIDFCGEFGSVYNMSHCDGLVMLRTDTKVYIINPATGDVLKLPDGQKDALRFETVGLGLDPRSNKYKVARSFYRSVNFSKQTYDAGMEVFTIGGGESCWREIDDPPYPIQLQTVMYFKGSFYWHICKKLLGRHPQGFLRFNLEDETFSFIWCPVLPSEEDQLDFVELHDELCLAQYLPRQIVIWMSPSGNSHVWNQHYIIELSEALRFKPLGMFNDGILVRSDNYLYRYDQESRNAREVVRVDQLRYKNPRVGSFDFVGEDLFFFNIIPYTESLVPLT